MRLAGIDPVTESTLVTVNDIPSEMTSVMNGQVDAAFVFQGARVVFGGAFADLDLFEELEVLYLSEGNIPNDAIAVQPDMDAALVDQIKKIFLEMNQDELGKDTMAMWSHMGYVEVYEANYDTIQTYSDKAAE